MSASASVIWRGADCLDRSTSRSMASAKPMNLCAASMALRLPMKRCGRSCGCFPMSASTPCSRASVFRSSPSCLTSILVSQAMPFPPLPTLPISGPTGISFSRVIAISRLSGASTPPVAWTWAQPMASSRKPATSPPCTPPRGVIKLSGTVKRIRIVSLAGSKSINSAPISSAWAPPVPRNPITASVHAPRLQTLRACRPA